MTNAHSIPVSIIVTAGYGTDQPSKRPKEPHIFFNQPVFCRTLNFSPTPISFLDTLKITPTNPNFT